MAVPVSKRGKRTLLGLGLSLFSVSIYWYFPAPSSWWSYDATPKFRDRDWSRFDEVRSLIYFTTLPPSASIPPTTPHPDTLIAMRGNEHLLSQHLTPYTFGAMSAAAVKDWKTEIRNIDKVTPLVIFSKTYCPYSRRVIQLIENYDVEPKPLIIEVDLREDGDVIKAQLQRLTGRGTFPNVLIQTHSIGGSDDVDAVHRSGTLGTLLRSAGLNVRGPHAI